MKRCCCVCGDFIGDGGYTNYRDQRFCWPCADGEKTDVSFTPKHRSLTGTGEWMGGESCCKTPFTIGLDLDLRHKIHGSRNSNPSQKCCCGEWTFHDMAKPVTTPAQTLTFKLGSREHTLTGTIDSIETESMGFDGDHRLTIKMYGQVESRKIHNCNCNHCDRSYE